MINEELEKSRTKLIDHIYNWYIKYNDIYRVQVNQTEHKIDTLIITISTGAIFLTITFYDTIIDTDIAKNYALLLKISWIFFVLAIIFTLIANRLSVSGILELQRKVETTYHEATDKISRNEIPVFPDFKNPTSKIIDFLNTFTLISVIWGIILAMSFAFLTF